MTVDMRVLEKHAEGLNLREEGDREQFAERIRREFGSKSIAWLQERFELQSLRTRHAMFERIAENFIREKEPLALTPAWGLVNRAFYGMMFCGGMQLRRLTESDTAEEALVKVAYNLDLLNETLRRVAADAEEADRKLTRFRQVTSGLAEIFSEAIERRKPVKQDNSGLRDDFA
jgi:hypothetical protein